MNLLAVIFLSITFPAYTTILSTKDPATINISTGFFPIWNKDDSRAPVKTLWTDNARKNKALPTNAWWLNAVLDTTPNNAILAEPYIIHVSDLDVAIFYGYISNDTPQQMQLGWIPSFPISLGCVEGITSHGVDSWDDMGVRVKYTSSSGSMTAPIVRGMPYVTMKYKKLTPKLGVVGLTIQNMTVWNTAGDITFPEAKPLVGSNFYGSKFELKVLEIDSTWRFYSSININLTYDGKYFIAKNSLAYGFFRIAMVNNCTFGTTPWHCPADCISKHIGTDTKEYKALVDAHAGAVVIGGGARYIINKNTVTFTFDWFKESFSGDSSVILMSAMPHHTSMFSANTSSQVVSLIGWMHQTLRGRQVMVKADRWVLEDTISVNGWHAMKPIPTKKIQDIKDALYGINEKHPTWNQSDLNWEIPINWKLGVGDTYYGGKIYARIARVALIADELGDTANATAIASQLKEYLTPWLDRTNSKAQPMMYDQTWGGLLSCGCDYDDCGGKCIPHCDNLDQTGSPITCPEMLDKGSNFGTGWYNDHHFHYGYFIYAFAVVGKFFPEWIQQYKEHTMLFVRDFANPDPDDLYFPRWRHKDWYAGFSWASGFSMTYINGRNQESSSEAVNAYYAIYLYGLALHDENIQTLGLALTAHEIRGAQTYWQIPIASDIYPRDLPNSYANVNTVVGIMWQNLIQYQTWFGNDPTYVHGIQHLPYTPISTQLLRSSWIKDEYDIWKNPSNPEWKVTQVCNQAIIDSAGAWTVALGLADSAFDIDRTGSDGHSRTNTLYWIATQ